MAYFPFFMDVEQMKGLVIGGGNVATRKVKLLLPFDAKLHVVASEASEELLEFQRDGRITLSLREFDAEDLDHVDFVVAASSDTRLNRRISEFCKAQRIPVNVVDVKDECSFLFPSLVREGCITAGICTGGSSPYLAKYLKTRVREAIPEGLGETAEMLGSFRPMVKETVSSQKLRERVFTEMAKRVMADPDNRHELTEQEVKELIRTYGQEEA